MQNTVGKLMECIVARKLARDLEDSDILPANRGGGWGGGEREFRQGNMYEGFQRKEAAVAVAIGLEDAYNRVQFKLLMDLHTYTNSFTMDSHIKVPHSIP